MTKRDPSPATPDVPSAHAVKPLSIDVRSECDDLHTVLVHRPGGEIDRLTTDNRSTFLFEEIPHLERMQREHDAFVGVLEAEGVRVLRLEDLLLDILNDPPTGRRLVRSVCELSLQRTLANILIEAFGDQPERIRTLLLTGLTTRELQAETGAQLDATRREHDFFLLRPLPNAYLTRDPGAVVGHRAICSNMNFDVRMPEALTLRTILTSHPLFRNVEFGFGADRSSQRPFTIEGGDIVVLSDQAIAVGCGERTNTSSIHLLAERLFDMEQVSRVYEVPIPARRSCVHLDTVFTVIDRGRIVAVPSMMDHVTEVMLYEPRQFGDQMAAVPVLERRSFREILEAELGGSLEVIEIAGDGGADAEQPGDATGVLAIGPSRVVAYDRDVRTNRTLREHGVEVIEIEGSELARGLGGPRCMAMPLRRSGNP